MRLRRRHRRPERHARRWRELGVLAQDRGLEIAQRCARLEPEPLRQLAARRAVGVERVRLAVVAVERKHQLVPEVLPQRVPRDERLQLGDQVGLAAEREVGVEALLEGGQAHLLEPCDLRLRELLVREIRERRAAPQRERLLQLAGRCRRRNVTRFGDQLLEAGKVELAGSTYST